MSTDGFFGQPSPQSVVKAEIVAKYFWAWAKVLYKEARRRGEPLRYVDLFAGRGQYDDGSPSTPLLVLSKAIGDCTFRDLVEAHLSDIRPEYSLALERAVRALPGLDSLRCPPVIEARAVDDTLTRSFEEKIQPPTLSFVDPWGYKGLSVRLVRALTKDRGCDCIFFFNYNRVNAGLSNPVVIEQMGSLFGRPRADELRARTRWLSSKEREQAIVDELRAAIEEDGSRKVLPFAFKFDSANRTSHYLVLTTKRQRPVGFEIMKNIMAKASTDAPQGVPTYVYNPAHLRPAPTRSEPLTLQLSLFPQPEPAQPPQPLDVLGERLLCHFADKTRSMVEVYREYNRIDDRYLVRNYKDALLLLETAGHITVDPPVTERRVRKGVPTLPDWVRITFPPRSE